MLAELIVEKFKKHEREVGMRIGRQEERQQWQAWYERQQAAQRAGQPFTEPPPDNQPTVAETNPPSTVNRGSLLRVKGY